MVIKDLRLMFNALPPPTTGHTSRSLPFIISLRRKLSSLTLIPLIPVLSPL
jgi:hypothetical protein